MSDSESDIESFFMLLNSSDSDNSSSDQENEKPRQYKQRINYFNLLESSEFQIRFRLDKSSVQELLTEIQPFLKVTKSRNHGIQPLHRLLLTLRFYALGTMLLSVADFIGVSKASACRIVWEISCAIAQLYKKYVYMHSDTIHYQVFHEYWVHWIAHMLGFQSPNSQIGEEFRNRKGYFSINVQAVCNAKLMLMNVVARWPGSAHDATIFNNSELRAQCENRLFGNKWLLGDSAYPIKPYLLTPLLHPSTRSHQLYNEAHIRTRNCIERCFGVWKRRFPIIALTLRLNMSRANAVIIATAVLHNICILKNLTEVPPEVAVPNSEAVPVYHPGDNDNTQERDNLIAQYFESLKQTI